MNIVLQDLGLVEGYILLGSGGFGTSIFKQNTT